MKRAPSFVLLLLTFLCVLPGLAPFSIAAERDGKVHLTQAPSLTVDGITNAASFLPGPVAPGEIVSIFGSDLGPTEGVGSQLDAAGRVSTSLAGTAVLFDNVPAPLYYVRNDQINLQVPYTVAGHQSTQVQVSVGGTLSEVVEVPVTENAPGIFAYAGGTGQAVMFNENWKLNSALLPAKPGSVAMFYATGEGQTDPSGIEGKLAEAPYPKPTAPVSMTIGGIAVTDIPYAGSAPGFAGLMQINARIPKTVKPGKAVPVVLTIGGHDSQTGITMAIASDFVISNVRATGTNTSQDATLVILVDFVDPSGAATSGDIIVNFDIDNGGIAGFGEFSRDGVKPGQTKGTMKLSFTFVGMNFRKATNVPIKVSLENSLGTESNEVVGTFTVGS